MKLSGLEPVWFEHGGAKFHLKPLKWSQVLQLGGLLSAGDLKESFEYACDRAIVDWSGIEDDKGPVKFSKEKLELLPIEAVATIAKQVIDANLLGAEAEKN